MTEQDAVNRKRDSSIEHEWLGSPASQQAEHRFDELMNSLDVTERNVEEVLQQLQTYRVIPKISTTTNT